jgi:hypothetical protein
MTDCTELSVAFAAAGRDSEGQKDMRNGGTE